MPYKILPKRIVSKNNAKVRFSYETTKGKSGKMRYFLLEELFGQGFAGDEEDFHKFLLMESM